MTVLSQLGIMLCFVISYSVVIGEVSDSIQREGRTAAAS